MVYSRDFLTTAGESFETAPMLPDVSILDQDVNLIQRAQSETRRAMVRNTTPSGWLDEIVGFPSVSPGNVAPLNTIYCTGDNNDLRIRGDLDVLVDGLQIRLTHCCGQSSTPAGSATHPFSGITLPAAPAVTFQPANGVLSRVGTRVDLVFLEVWKKEVFSPLTTGVADRRVAGLADDANYFNFGNTQPGTATLPTLANDMIDPAVGGETTRRIQRQYRLRVWQDVNPSTNVPPLSQSVRAWPAHKRTEPDGVAVSTYNFAQAPDDVGLWIAGDGTPAARAALGTFDGFCYAVPIALVCRRNTGVWGYMNFNGSTGRIDGKTANVHSDDILDIRHNVAIGNAFDKKAIHDKTVEQVLTGDLRTSYEEWLMNADGNQEFTPSGIYGTRLIRAEGVAGSAAPVNNSFQQTWHLQHCRAASNGVSTALDGMRNYFSDVGGDQVVSGLVPNVAADGVGTSPSLFASYLAATRTLVVNAANMQSGGGVGVSRTRVSPARPLMRWAVPPTLQGGYFDTSVSGTWSNLGTDSASFVVDNRTRFFIESSGVITGLAVGDVYRSSNLVDLTVVGFSTVAPHQIAFSFAGSVIPLMTGAFTRITGAGPSTLTPQVTVGFQAVVAVATTAALSGLRMGAVYNGPDAVQYHVMEVRLAERVFFIRRGSGSGAHPSPGTWTKVSGDGPASIVATGHPVRSLGQSISGEVSTRSWSIVGVGSNVMPSTAGFHINAFVRFAPGSGFLSRLPHRDCRDIKATHYNIQVGAATVQALPNNGIGFRPVGTSASPRTDGGRPPYSHTRATGMMRFLRDEPILGAGTETHGRRSVGSRSPCVLRDGGVYRMWFIGWDSAIVGRVLHSTSVDGVSWADSQLVMDIGVMSGFAIETLIGVCVIRDGATLRMWFSGRDSAGHWRIFNSTSSDGLVWTAPTLAMGLNTDPSGGNEINSIWPWVIRDGATFRMWFSGVSVSHVWQILYSTSSNGVSWEPPFVVISPSGRRGEADVEYANVVAPTVIREGSRFSMWLAGSTGAGHRTLFTNSIDGATWGPLSLFVDDGVSDAGNVHITELCVIKDGPVYRSWHSELREAPSRDPRIFHSVFSMIDPANIGSSTTGVYPTAGGMQHAPPANSQVVVFYEAPADQHDRTMIGNYDVRALLHQDEKFYATTLGTGRGDIHLRLSPYRHFHSHLFPVSESWLPYMDTLRPLSETGLASNEISAPYRILWHPVNDTFAVLRANVGQPGVAGAEGYLRSSQMAGLRLFTPLTASGFVSAGVSIFSPVSLTGSLGFLGLDIDQTFPGSICGFSLWDVSRTMKLSAARGGIARGELSRTHGKIMNPVGRPILK